MPAIEKTEASPVSGAHSRRSVIKAAAWGMPAVAVAAMTPLAAATTPVTTNWVAAVRTTNVITNPTSSTNPGFRFGSAGAVRTVTATISLTTTTAGLTFAQTFVPYGSHTWSWSVVNHGDGTYTYTASASLAVGPADFNSTAPVPGGTTGVTIRGVHGTYSSSVVPVGSTDLHTAAGFTY